MSAQSNTNELDVRGLPKPQKHPTIFAAYGDLDLGESFVLVNDHDPKHLRDQFDDVLRGEYGWEYLSREPRNWRIRITRQTSTPPPAPPVANPNDGSATRHTFPLDADS